MSDLTATLFEEAHEMVRTEKKARFLAEKRATEAQARIDVRSRVLWEAPFPQPPSPKPHCRLI
jgi:hypothetical protein